MLRARRQVLKIRTFVSAVMCAVARQASHAFGCVAPYSVCAALFAEAFGCWLVKFLRRHSLRVQACSCTCRLTTSAMQEDADLLVVLCSLWRRMLHVMHAALCVGGVFCVEPLFCRGVADSPAKFPALAAGGCWGCGCCLAELRLACSDFCPPFTTRPFHMQVASGSGSCSTSPTHQR